MGRLNSIAVREQVRDEVASKQARDFTACRVVINGHLRVAVEIIVGGGAVNVSVHAFRILVVLRAVSVLEAEFIAIAAQPCALCG